MDCTSSQPCPTGQERHEGTPGKEEKKKNTARLYKMKIPVVVLGAFYKKNARKFNSLKIVDTIGR